MSVLAAAGNIQTVAVGENGFRFTPDSILAPVGSVVQFEFYPFNHSVVQGDFSNPCQPLAGGMGFYSGYQVVTSGVAAQVFSVMINDTNPIYFYCSQPIYSHCQAGMVGVINPPTAGDPPQSVLEYRAAAMMTNSSSTPARVQGGVYGSPAPQPNTTSITQAPTVSSSKTINTDLIGITLPPYNGAPSQGSTSGFTSASPSSSPGLSPSVSGSANSTVSYGGLSACPASSGSAKRKR